MDYREMTLPDVLALLDLTDELGIVPWLNGGWGVDALLGEQSRRHSDLDLFLAARDAPVLIQHLTARGFEPVPRGDTRPWNFVHGDPHGRDVDFHLIELDAGGSVHYGPDEVFPAALLDGYGTVGGRTVRCISPEWEVRFHTGYEPDENDWLGVSRLCERYRIAIPPVYDRFRG